MAASAASAAAAAAAPETTETATSTTTYAEAAATTTASSGKPIDLTSDGLARLRAIVGPPSPTSSNLCSTTISPPTTTTTTTAAAAATGSNLASFWNPAAARDDADSSTSSGVIGRRHLRRRPPPATSIQEAAERVANEQTHPAISRPRIPFVVCQIEAHPSHGLTYTRFDWEASRPGIMTPAFTSNLRGFNINTDFGQGKVVIKFISKYDDVASTTAFIYTTFGNGTFPPNHHLATPEWRDNGVLVVDVEFVPPSYSGMNVAEATPPGGVLARLIRQHLAPLARGPFGYLMFASIPRRDIDEMHHAAVSKKK